MPGRPKKNGNRTRMEDAQVLEAPPLRTQGGEAPVQRVQGGRHRPEEPSLLRFQVPPPVDAGKCIHRLRQQDDAGTSPESILKLHLHLHHGHVRE